MPHVTPEVLKIFPQRVVSYFQTQHRAPGGAGHMANVIILGKIV